MTVRGASLTLNNGVTTYGATDATLTAMDATLTVGPSTIVTADDSAAGGLNYNSIGVGQHVIARGIYTLPNNVVTLDATGSSTNTGSVRLITTSLFGSLISAGANSLLLNLTTINDWPVSIFSFAGNGLSAATDPSPLNYSVNTGTLAIPVTTPGDPAWVDGLVAPFGSAPPDFTASAINSETMEPASLQVSWTGPGTAAPFSVLSATGLSVDLANPALSSAVLRFGAQSVAMTSLAGSPLIVPATGTAAGTTTSVTTNTAVSIPATFTPLFSVGDPTVAAPGGISVFSVFSSYVTQLTASLAATPALQLEARGLYNRAANTFTATSISVVL